MLPCGVYAEPQTVAPARLAPATPQIAPFLCSPRNSYTRKDFKSFRFSTYKQYLMMLKTNDFKPFRISRSTIFARNPFGFSRYVKTWGEGGGVSPKLSPRRSVSGITTASSPHHNLGVRRHRNAAECPLSNRAQAARIVPASRASGVLQWLSLESERTDESCWQDYCRIPVDRGLLLCRAGLSSRQE